MLQDRKTLADLYDHLLPREDLELYSTLDTKKRNRNSPGLGAACVVLGGRVGVGGALPCLPEQDIV